MSDDQATEHQTVEAGSRSFDAGLDASGDATAPPLDATPDGARAGDVPGNAAGPPNDIAGRAPTVTSDAPAAPARAGPIEGAASSSMVFGREARGSDRQVWAPSLETPGAANAEDAREDGRAARECDAPSLGTSADEPDAANAPESLQEAPAPNAERGEEPAHDAAHLKPDAAASERDLATEPVEGPSRLDADEARRAIDAAADVPGGKAFYAPSDPTAQTAAVLGEFPGRRKYDLHGTQDGVIVPGHGLLDAASFADIVRADPGWQGQPIMLFSCDTGKVRADGRSFAQDLADDLGVPVTAPTELAWSDEAGNFYSASAVTDTNGIDHPNGPPWDGSFTTSLPVDREGA